MIAIFKMDTKKELLHGTGNSAQWYMAAWMGRKFAGELDTCICIAGSLHVHLELSHC